MRVLTLLLLLFATFASAEEYRADFDGRPGRVWLPATTAPAPLILFSHSFGGCPAQARYLTEGLAAAGYVVAAPEHADHACGWPGRPELPFREPENWTPKVFQGRRDDLRATLAALRADPSLAARIDWDRIGIMGHSLGGYAGLGLAGAIPGWETPGIDAVLVMSPYCTPFIYRGGLDRVKVPVLYQGGSRDRPVTPTVTRPGGCFDLTPSPAWYVEIEHAWHLSWTWLAAAPRVRAAILANAVDFFDATLRETGRVQRRPGISGMRAK